MSESPEQLKFRILMCMLMSSSANCTVTGISRSLQEEKYTITRAMQRMEQEGLIDRSNVRAPVLTQQGREQARRYSERVRIAENHLLYEGIDVEHARQDACVWALNCSEQLMDVLRANDERYRVKHALREYKNFSGALLCRNLKDGTYYFPFIIYREQVKNNSNVSMANSGFEHPCALHVENGEGTIQLQLLPMSQKSVVSGCTLSGRVSSLEYLENGRFISGEFHSNGVSFPASALNFINIGSGMGQILHGSVCLQMQCSCGITHMPQSRALFTILI